MGRWNPGKIVTGVLTGGAVGGPAGSVLGGMVGAGAIKNPFAPNNVTSNVPIQTPDQAAAARNSDIEAGQNRWKQLFAGPEIDQIKKAREEGLQGLDSQTMEAARQSADYQMRGQQQQQLRQLLSQQGRSGIRGGLAGSQQSDLLRKFAADKADQERKMLVDNYNLKQSGLDKYQDLVFRDKFGELAQGLGEAGLGVADRTGYQQALIAQQMANAAGKDNRGVLGRIFSGIL